MGAYACLLVFLVTALATVVYCANERPQTVCGPRCQMMLINSGERQRKGCDRRCLMKTLTSGAGKRKKSVDSSKENHLWNQDAAPTFTNDDEGQRSQCILDQIVKKLSPKWQDRLLQVIEDALNDNNEEPTTQNREDDVFDM